MSKSFISSISAFVVVLVFVGSAAAQMSVPGQIIDIVDGRTVVIAIASGKVKVELQYIDVPEPGQDLHQTVVDHLRGLVIGKAVVYRPKTILGDRTVGRVLLGNDVDISQQMLRDGAAWLIPTQLSGQDKTEYAIYAALESAAKSEKRGIWSITELRPAWEVRAERAEREKPRVQAARVPEAPPKPVEKRKPGMWGDINPRLGDVGALLNGYNAETRTGYLSTPLLGVTQAESDKATDHKTAVDITYYYKEDDKNGRKGVFVVNLISFAKMARFLKSNDLIMVVDAKNVVIGKAKSKMSKDTDNNVIEELTYNVDRTSIQKITDGSNVHLKIGDYIILPSGGLLQILNNMLQLSA